MAEVTKQQIEDFKRRKAAGYTATDNDLANHVSFKLTPKQLQSFLKATDRKCDGDG